MRPDDGRVLMFCTNCGQPRRLKLKLSDGSVLTGWYCMKCRTLNDLADMSQPVVSVREREV